MIINDDAAVFISHEGCMNSGGEAEYIWLHLTAYQITRSRKFNDSNTSYKRGVISFRGSADVHLRILHGRFLPWTDETRSRLTAERGTSGG